MRDEPSVEGQVRTAEVIATLSLATDLGMGFPLEHGLHSALVALRLAEQLDVDHATARQVYYGCLLFYVGCTADAEVAARDFDDDIHTHYLPAMFGPRAEVLRALTRAIAPPGSASPPVRAGRIARRLPEVMRGYRTHVTAQCEVAQMLTDRVGAPSEVRRLFGQLNERWDGKGHPGEAGGAELPLALRIVHVARDVALQAMLQGEDAALGIVAARAGRAFDPAIVACLGDHRELLSPGLERSAWDRVLAAEPAPWLHLAGDAVDRALAAMGDFADLVSPYLVGHSSGVADLVSAAAARGRLTSGQALNVRRAALVHDLGRVTVPAGIWQKPGVLTHDEWEKVRLHSYYTERVLTPSPFLAGLAQVASADHERLDGSGYHRGFSGSALNPEARLLAVADAFQAMTEPRPHREALARDHAAETLALDASEGRLDADAVAAVIEAADLRVPRIERPAGLTEREAEVVGLLARGHQTKQIGSALGISIKTADRHIQNAYAKIGVSTRAAAAVYAMEHGLVAWGELPIATRATQV